MTLFGTLLPFALAVALWLLARLSQRLGDVTQSAPHYRWLYVSSGMLAGSAIVKAYALILLDKMPDTLLALTLLHDALFGLGLLLGVVVSWRYWGWMLSERDDQG